MRIHPYSGNLELDGFEIHHGLFSEEDLSHLEGVSAILEAMGTGKGGGRNVFSSHPELLAIFKGEKLLSLVRQILGARIGLSEGLYLNKKVEANWLVSWHQDLFISVKAESSVEGYSGWTMKQGKPYVQPPPSVLEQSVWVRLNLDVNGIDAGCLKVVPGSHRLGKVNPEEIGQVVEKHGELALPCKRGDTILFRPLLLHASSKSMQPSQRRVFQVLYSGFQFQNGLEWPY